MNLDFQRLIREATDLTRRGDRASALATIQAALARAGLQPPAGSPPAAGGPDVIDVEARVVGGHGTAPDGAAPRATEAWQGGRFDHAAGSRDYKLFVPPAVAGRPRALVVMLHGCTQNPDDFAAGTRMNEVARQHNALVLYPAQWAQANAQGCWNWFKHNHQEAGRGEPALLAALTRHVMTTHGVSPGHVFVAGLSAGGAMAAILGATHPDLYAAVGVHSGLAAGAARDLPSALAAMKHGGRPAAGARQVSPPTITFHGDADQVVHPHNATHVVAATSASPLRAEAAERGDRGGRGYTRRIHRDTSGDVRAELWLVHGAGHAWSGGSPAGSYADAQGPDASEEMMRFFMAQAGRTRG